MNRQIARHLLLVALLLSGCDRFGPEADVPQALVPAPAADGTFTAIVEGPGRVQVAGEARFRKPVYHDRRVSLDFTIGPAGVTGAGAGIFLSVPWTSVAGTYPAPGADLIGHATLVLMPGTPGPPVPFDVTDGQVILTQVAPDRLDGRFELVARSKQAYSPAISLDIRGRFIARLDPR